MEYKLFIPTVLLLFPQVTLGVAYPTFSLDYRNLSSLTSSSAIWAFSVLPSDKSGIF
jgi:hypothetical protein